MAIFVSVVAMDMHMSCTYLPHIQVDPNDNIFDMEMIKYVCMYVCITYVFLSLLRVSEEVAPEEASNLAY